MSNKTKFFLYPILIIYSAVSATVVADAITREPDPQVTNIILTPNYRVEVWKQKYYQASGTIEVYHNGEKFYGWLTRIKNVKEDAAGRDFPVEAKGN